MPWYMTAYRADRTQAKTDGSIAGAYGGYMWARGWKDAARVVKARGIAEEVEGTVWPHGKMYVLPSTWLAKRKAEPAKVMHSLCWLGHLAICAKVATPDEILGDEGLLHEYVHLLAGASDVTRAQLVTRAKAIEARIPGFLSPTMRRAGGGRIR